MIFDPTKHYLGTLCKHGHEYENSGKSLRYIKLQTGHKTGACPLCQKNRSTKYLNTTNGKNKKSETQRKWRKNNPEKMKKYRIERTFSGKSAYYSKQWRKNNPEKAKQSKKKYYKNHPEQKVKEDKIYYQRHVKKVKQSVKLYRLNNPDKIRLKAKIKARKERTKLALCYLNQKVIRNFNIKISEITKEHIEWQKTCIALHRFKRELSALERKGRKYYGKK